MKKEVQKIVSALLTLMLLIQIVQLSVYALDNIGKEELKETTTNELVACSDSEMPNIVCEIEDKRTEFSKTFKMDDGSFNEITSSIPLHVLQNDTWTDVYTIDYNESYTIEQVTESIDRELENISTQITKNDNRSNHPDRSSPNYTATSQSIVRTFTYDFDDEEYYGNNSCVVENESSYVFIKPNSLAYGLTRFVVNAGVYVNCNVSGLTDEDVNYVGILKAIDNWNETTTTYDCNNLDDKIYDSHNITSSGYYLWDITELYHLWERNEVPNYGIVLSALDDNSPITIVGTNLYFITNYREINPLDNSFPSYSFDMGRAGIIKVNEFTNNIVVERNDLGIDGAIMPVLIKGLYYDNNLGSSIQYGYNWRFNYNSQLIKNGNSFIWTNPNGQVVYFERDTGFPMTDGYTKWIEEESNYTLMVNENYTNAFVPDFSHNYIESSDSYTYEFDSGNGYGANLISVTDSANKSITISYQNGNIDYIQDGVGRKYVFNYDSIDNSNILGLTSIDVCDSNGTPITIDTVNNQSVPISINYSYSISSFSRVPLLTAVSFQDNQTVTYSYDNYDRISRVTNIDGTTLLISHANDDGATKTEYKKYKGTDSNILDYIEVDTTYTYLKTIKDKYNSFSQYSFNRYLQVQGYKKYHLGNNGKQVVDEKEYYTYKEGGSIKSVFSDDVDNANSLLLNPSFETAFNKTGGAWVIDDNVSRVSKESASSVYFPVNGGAKELKIEGDYSSPVCASQEIDVSSETDFPDCTVIALSGWVKIGPDNIPAPSHFIGIKVYAQYNNISRLVEVSSVPFDANIICEWQYNLSCFRLDREYENNTIDKIIVKCECDYQVDECDVRFDELKMFITDDYYETSEPRACNCTNCSYGVGCPCECASEAVCNCPECNVFFPQLCACGSSCHFGDGCQCTCASAAVCNCVSCKSYTHVDTDALNHTVRTVTTDGLKEMIYEKTFSADDNYVIEEADENGIEVSYNYANPKNGLITSSEDSYGTTTYAYDAMGRLAEIKTAVSGLSNGATHIKNEYSYQNDRISSITHNGFSYNFLYNDYGDYYIIKVGNQNLVTYDYNEKQQINCVTYGNNNSFYFTYSGENITEIKDTQYNTIYQYDYDSDGNLNKIIDNKSGLTTEFGVTKHIDHATYFISKKVDEMNQANAAYIAENGNENPENMPYSNNDFNNVSLDDLYCEEIVYRTDNPRDIRYAIVVEDEGTYEYFAEDEFYNYNSETSYNPQTGVSINSKKTKIDYNWKSITTAYSQDVFGRMINTEDMQEKIGADVYDDMSAAQIVVERNSENLPKSINKTNFYYNDSISTVHPQITGLSSDITVTNNLYDANYILKKYDDIDTYWSEFEDYEFEYDNSNRLVRAYLQNGNIIQEDVRYTYNSNNLIIREDHYYSYNSSFSYTFSYGNSGKINGYSFYAYTLSTLGDPLSEYLVIYLNENDTYYSAAKNTWHYKYEYSYDFDNNGNIIAVYDGLDETTRVLLARYNYDSAGQLIREDNSIDNKSYTYMYDAGGNIAQKCEYTYSLNSLGTATKTITYSYDSTWKDKMTGYNGKPLTYDLIGNPTAYGSANNNGDEYRVYSWNGKQLESCSIFNCNNTPGVGYEYVYEYDYEGNICRITSYEYNWLNGNYISDHSHPRVTEFTWKDGSLVYQCLNPQPISSSQPANYYPGILEQNSDLTIRYLYDDNNEPYGFITEGTRLFYYQKNLQGDITGIIQPSSQKCFLNYSYDAFGNMSYEMNYSGVTELLAAMSLLNNQVLAYRGYMYDLITGMYYLHSRFYVPEWGRFLNSDSLCDTETSIVGTNVYVYCDNNPVNRIDPTGFASVVVNIYSGILGHADISIGGTTYAFGNYQAAKANRWDQIVGKAQGYLIVATKNSWLSYQKTQRNVDTFELNISENEKKSILSYCLNVLSKSDIDRIPKSSLYSGTIYKIKNGEYKNYSLIYNNCVHFTTRSLSAGIRARLSNVSKKYHENEYYFETIFSPRSLRNFMLEYMAYYRDTKHVHYWKK